LDKETAERYLKKSGDDYIETENLIENEHGFMSWRVHRDKFVCMNVYGNGRYWDDYMNELAKQFNCKSIVTSTSRSYKAYERKFNFKLKGYILEKEVI
jgi:hypothetical protein